MNFVDKHWDAAPPSSQRVWGAQVETALAPAPEKDDDRPLMLPLNESLEEEVLERV